MAIEERPGAGWYALPAGLLVLTIILVIALFPGASILDPVLDTRTLTLPGEQEVEFAKPGPYFIYRDQAVSWEVPLEFTVTRADGADPLPLSPIGMSTTFTSGDRKYLAVRRFEIDAPGTLRVKGVYASGVVGRPQTVIIAPALEFRSLFSGVMRILACVLTGVLGLVLTGLAFVLILLRRRRRPLLPMPTPVRD